MKSRILYIEDNEQNFYLVSFLPTSRGHQVQWAKDARSGIESAERGGTDIVLLDIQLPVTDG